MTQKTHRSSKKKNHPFINDMRDKKNNPLITGTLMLTVAGFITRIIGFFNRIYLSQLIGAKEMGIYQLIFPVYMVAFAFCCHGIELALSQLVAAFYAGSKNKSSSERSDLTYNSKVKETLVRECHVLVKTATALSLIGALLFSALIYYYADYISITILKEESCAVCLKLMAPVLPFTAVRCCLHGYYIGLKKTFVPAAGQLIEQVVRVVIIWLIAESYGDTMNFSASLAVCGMVVGEIAGTIYTYISYKLQTSTKNTSSDATKHGILPYGRKILKRAIPLTGNKLSLTFVSSLESVLIPFMLTNYYKDQDIALSMYGVLTGMALPFITFPSTLTNSLSVMLLPAISEANASGNKKQIHHTIEKTTKICLSLGFAALFVFFLFGRQIGTYLFHNKSAGDFLFILSFLCPFLYLSSSGTSILNGLGLMKQSFFYSLISIAIRIGFILFAIPLLGIQGYLLGLLAAFLVLVLLQFKKIRRSV